MHWAVGAVASVLLFTLSFLFWKWFGDNKEKDDYNMDDVNFTPEDEQNEGTDSKILDKLLSNSKNDIMAGSNDKYDWMQNSREVEVYVHLEPDVKRKEVKCSIEKDSIFLEVRGEKVMDGFFYANVIPDECNWQLDGDGSQRKVWISLYKEIPTKQNQHWRYVVEGDEEIDTSSLGPPVHTLDVNNKDAMKEAMSQVGLLEHT